MTEVDEDLLIEFITGEGRGAPLPNTDSLLLGNPFDDIASSAIVAATATAAVPPHNIKTQHKKSKSYSNKKVAEQQHEEKEEDSSSDSEYGEWEQQMDSRVVELTGMCTHLCAKINLLEREMTSLQQENTRLHSLQLEKADSVIAILRSKMTFVPFNPCAASSQQAAAVAPVANEWPLSSSFFGLAVPAAAPTAPSSSSAAAAVSQSERIRAALARRAAKVH